MRSISIVLSLLGIILCVYLVVVMHRLTASHFVIHQYDSPSVVFSEGPKDYYKNKHVVYECNRMADRYDIRFQFKDQENRLKSWHWSYDVPSTDAAILKYGVPNSLFEVYIATDSALRSRKAMLVSAMFRREGDYIVPDVLAMIRYYSVFLTPIRLALNQAKDEYISRRARLELLVKFCEDIPYGVPPNNFNNKYTAGLVPPPQVFINGWGDCDSKALIFATTSLSIDRNEVLFLYETGHLLVAINGIPKPYDTYYSYENRQYIVADVSGPGRSDLGQIGDPYRNFSKVVLFKNIADTQNK